MTQTTAKPVYCRRRQQRAAMCETPDACAGGIDCRLGPDLPSRMNPWPARRGSQTTDPITDAMIERACRAYVRGVQRVFDDDVPDFNSDEWQQFEDDNWSNESLPIRLALEAALS